MDPRHLINLRHSQFPTTIGTKIDSVIAQIDAIPHTYLAFVIVCCVFAFTVLNLNSNHSSAAAAAAGKMSMSANAKSKDGTANANVRKQECSSGKEVGTGTHKAAVKVSKTNDEEPQPKWHILKLLNILSVIGLLTSFFYFASNASSYLNDSHAILKFMALWSAFLCYFFGFFGISFIDVDELELQRERENSSRAGIGMVNANGKGKVATICNGKQNTGNEDG